MLLPWKTSRINSNTILVKGIAQDGSDISSIKVNGKSATITPAQTETLNNGEQLVHWEAKIMKESRMKQVFHWFHIRPDECSHGEALMQVLKTHIAGKRCLYIR